MIIWPIQFTYILIPNRHVKVDTDISIQIQENISFADTTRRYQDMPITKNKSIIRHRYFFEDENSSNYIERQSTRRLVTVFVFLDSVSSQDFAHESFYEYVAIFQKFFIFLLHFF